MGAKTEEEKEEGERFHRGGEVWYICIVYKEETGGTKEGKQGWKEISKLQDGPIITVSDCCKYFVLIKLYQSIFSISRIAPLSP